MTPHLNNNKEDHNNGDHNTNHDKNNHNKDNHNKENYNKQVITDLLVILVFVLFCISAIIGTTWEVEWYP